VSWPAPSSGARRRRSRNGAPRPRGDQGASHTPSGCLSSGCRSQSFLLSLDEALALLLIEVELRDSYSFRSPLVRRLHGPEIVGVQTQD
jgi:hypothetical protein